MSLRTSPPSWTCQTDCLSMHRKKRCDGRHPTCSNCEQLQIQCGGYKTKVIWEDDAIRRGMRRRGPTKAKQLSNRTHELRRDDKEASSPCELIHTSPATDVVQNTTSVNEYMPTCDSQTEHGARHGRRDQLGFSTASGAFFYMAHQSNTSSYTTAESISHLSQYPLNLTPIQSIFLDNYINNFSLIYPTHSDSNNPFLSTLIPLALRNETVLHAMLALSGIQVENSEAEVLRLRGRAIKGCRKLLEKCGATGQSDRWAKDSIGAINSSKGDVKLKAEGQSQIAVDDEDDLALIASVLLMILYDKLSGTPCDDVGHHLVFAHFLFEKKMSPNKAYALPEEAYPLYSAKNKQGTRGMLRHMSSHYKFFYSLFLYNDLLAGMASNRPTLSGYDLAINALALGENPGYSTWVEEPSSMVAQIKKRYYFPILLSIISNRHTEVSMAEIDAWDRRMSWLPSFSTVNDNLTSLLSTNRQPNTAHHTGPQGAASPGTTGAFEDYIISELYVNAARIFYIQRVRGSSCSVSPVVETIYDPQAVQLDHDISNFTSAFVDQLRLLPENSTYENALLWPIGVAAKEMTDPSDMDYLLWRLNKLEQKFKLKHFRKFTDKITVYWGRVQNSLLMCDGMRPAFHRHRLPEHDIIHEAILLG